MSAHFKPGVWLDPRPALLRFEPAFDQRSNCAELIAAMANACPDAGPGLALEIGAKVSKGEMAWRRLAESL